MKLLAWWAWFAVCVGGAALLLSLMWRALDGSVFMFCVGCQEGLDAAQAAFEAKERDKHYDFDGWRRDGEVKCQNAPTLRICRATPIVARADGSPVRDFMTFACSATECAWVDP